MANSKIRNTHYLGQGAVYVRKRDADGAIQSFFPIGTADSLDINHAQTTENALESISGLRAVEAQAVTETNITYSITVRNFSKEILALALKGEAAAVSGATITDEAHIAGPNGVIQLKYTKVSSVSVESEDGETTYVAGTDYSVDETNGRVDIISSGGISEGDIVNVSYTHAAQHKVEALTDPGTAEVEFVFEGANQFMNSEPVKVRMYRAVLNLADALSLIGTTGATFTISGALLPAPEITSGSQYYTVVMASQNTLYTA